MYAENAQISHRQLYRQMVTGLTGILFLTVPVMPGLSGRQGILALISGTGVYLILCTYFVRIKTVFQYPEKYMGKTAARFFILSYLSWLWLMGVYLLLMITRITQRFLVEGSMAWVVILLAEGAAYLGSHQGLERRARMAEVCFPFLVFIFGGMFLLGTLRMKPVYLQEMGNLSLEGWASGSMGGGILLISGFLAVSFLLLQGSFGLGGYEHKEYPLVDFMAGIQIPGDFLERVDVFWVAAALFSVLFSLGSVFFYQHELLLRIKMEKTALAAAVGILAAAIFCQHQKISAQWFMHITVKYYGPVFAVLLIWAGIAVRKKRTWKKAGVLGVLLILMTYLAGCGVSLEKRISPLSMSADYVQGNYRIIYGIPELTGMTGQNKKDTEESQPQAIVYEGKTPEEAEENFNRNQKNYLDMGHIKTLILGEEILEQKDALEGLLDALERKPSVAGNIYVFACQNPEELMKLDGQGKDSVGDFLTGILENNLEGKPKDAVTLQDLYNAWHRKEKIPELPIVTVVNNKPEIRQYS